MMSDLGAFSRTSYFFPWRNTPSWPIRPSDALKPRCSPHWRPRALPANANPTPSAHRMPEISHQNPSQHARSAHAACNASTHTPTLITPAAARACSVPPVHTHTRLSRICRVRRSPVLRAAHPVRLHGGGGGHHGQLAAGWLPQVAKTGEQWRWRRLAREALATGRGPRRFWREWRACAAVAPRAARPPAHAARCCMRHAHGLVEGGLGGQVRSLSRTSRSARPLHTNRRPGWPVCGSMLAVGAVSACMLHVGISAARRRGRRSCACVLA